MRDAGRGVTTFGELCSLASGRPPYAYQQRLADDGLPDLLRAPTGAGKTLAATLPWLYRRRFHSDQQVRASTPGRLVVVLPQRSLVEQTVTAVSGWLDNLGLAEDVGLQTLLGGLATRDQDWQRSPDRDAVFVGTQDMVLSRLLLRGYAEPKASWPISFGLLHAGTQFVFDEVQLMGPALPTSLQLAGLRDAFGTAAPCQSMWMSATVDLERFETPDAPSIGAVVDVGADDRSGPLRQRLAATRLIGHAATDPKRYAASLASEVLEHHNPGSRTIVVLNTVDRAGQVYDAIRSCEPASPVVLLHSRFRPRDRRDRMQEALGDPGQAGTIVVATQVLEAGVDIDSRLLVTEVAPWSSIVQRAGRCNRAGDYAAAELLWTEPPAGRGSAAPYDELDLLASVAALTELDGVAVTSSQLQACQVAEVRPLHPVLRRRDLMDLFDTAPDLSGNDLDVSRWVRDTDTITASVAWCDYGQAGPPADAPAPSRDELCPVPLTELRQRLKDRTKRAWTYDQTDSIWRRADQADARPGAVLVLDMSQGGYLVDRGWAPTSARQVPAVEVEANDPPAGFSSDALSTVGRWVPLAEHLEDVRREVDRLLDRYGDLPGLTPDARAAASTAGLYHDLGKVHEVFAASLAKAGTPPAPGPWAKSDGRGRLRHSRPGFRHELVSALMLLEPSSGLLNDVAEPDLVAFLVAAHHGKVRLSARSSPSDTGERVLGVDSLDGTPAVDLPDGRQVPALTLHRDVLEVGAGVLGDSWQARTCRLRDRQDLGPFRLAFLEAVVRLADWTASSSYEAAS